MKRLALHTIFLCCLFHKILLLRFLLHHFFIEYNLCIFSILLIAILAWVLILRSFKPFRLDMRLLLTQHVYELSEKIFRPDEGYYLSSYLTS